MTNPFGKICTIFNKCKRQAHIGCVKLNDFILHVLGHVFVSRNPNTTYIRYLCISAANFPPTVMECLCRQSLGPDDSVKLWPGWARIFLKMCLPMLHIIDAMCVLNFFLVWFCVKNGSSSKLFKLIFCLFVYFIDVDFNYSVSRRQSCILRFFL